MRCYGTNIVPVSSSLTVIQDLFVTVYACVCTGIDLVGLGGFHYVNNKAERARDRYMVGAQRGGILH